MRKSGKVRDRERVTERKSDRATEKQSQRENGTQISYYYRVIGPEEYDKAAQCCPASCPLIAMGDLRTGQQVWH